MLSTGTAGVGAVPTWSLKVDDIILMDLDGSGQTKDDQVLASAELGGGSDFDLDVSIENSQLTRLVFTARAEVFADVTVQGRLAFGELNYLKNFESPSFSRVFVVWVGYVPVVLNAKVQPTVRAHGTVSSGVRASIRDTLSVVAGASYADGGVDSFSDFSNSFEYQPPIFTAQAKLKVSVGPLFRLFVWGAIEPEVQVKPFLEAEAFLNTDLNWRLYAGLDVGVIIVGEVLAFHFLNIEFAPELISFRRSARRRRWGKLQSHRVCAKR